LKIWAAAAALPHKKSFEAVSNSGNPKRPACENSIHSQEPKEMKYIAMVVLDRNSEAARNYEAGMPPDPKLEEAMGQHIEEMTNRGILLETAGLLPLGKGARVRAAGGKLTVTDGPFIESKEIVGGYAILRAKSKEEAIELGKAFMKLHLDALGQSYEGAVEVRQMFDPVDFAPESARD
jgi:hypothetical protein